MEIRRLGRDDLDALTAVAPLFDKPVKAGAAKRFLSSEDHYLFVAYENERAVGFISGVEMTHPDKGTEMFVYELAVDESFRRRGCASKLLEALADVARRQRCYGMWVAAEASNAAALATYRASGGEEEPPVVHFSWRLTQQSE